MISSYFDPPPSGWGLRGDPGLWMEMKVNFEKMPIPENSKELEKILHAMFKDLVGHEPKRDIDYYVAKYNTGGMSAGKVCSDWWLDEGFPLIINRYNQL